ncbi:ABC transporter substrate-binding protein [Frankia sp. AiPs1]|uniref:ABC transporter substrate-binding protein n=1 Tax=Frankia sp. AiPs1 TaxID=573493 RepID=UPI002043D55C|nr:ABC transporter substrate-binding protein [Frankia sp. AiPs1]MCM3923256.1 ABC transporter substrate-binding protein [Frankia sp. AiPs1]
MRRRGGVVTLALGAVAAMLIAGCGGSTTGAEAGSTSSASPTSATSSAPHSVTDSTGVAVRIPGAVHRIADSWPAHNEVVQMLGGGDKIVATVLTPSSAPWLYTISPALRQAKTVFTSTTANTEELLTTHPDVLFNNTGTQIQAKTTSVGVPTLQLAFQTFDGLKKVVNTTADVLGPEARTQAQRYNAYLDAKLAQIRATSSKIPTEQRPKVLHIYSLNPLVVDGTDSIIDEWITAAGGRNAAQVKGNVRPTTTEAVASWNPDVIILASSAFTGNDTGQQTLAKLTSDPFWKNQPAVRDHHAYVNPTGGWHWDRYGIEEALQIQWAAKTLHPAEFAGLNIIQETKTFFHDFLHYTLTDAQAKRIVDAENPA